MLADVQTRFGLARPFHRVGNYETEHQRALVREVCAVVQTGRLVVVSGLSRDSGERRDDLLRLSSASRQNGGVEQPAGRVRRCCASDDPSRRRHADVDAGVDAAARGCRLRGSLGPAAVLGAIAGSARPSRCGLRLRPWGFAPDRRS